MKVDIRSTKSGCASASVLLIMGWLVIVCVAVFGWGSNIYKITQMDNIGSMEGIMRIVGVPVAPVGAVLGYVDLSNTSNEITINVKQEKAE